MGKAKYKSIRKAKNVKKSSVPNFVPCDKLAKYINELDIGALKDIQEVYEKHLKENDKVEGV